MKNIGRYLNVDVYSDESIPKGMLYFINNKFNKKEIIKMQNIKRSNKPNIKLNRGKIEFWLAIIFLAGLSIALLYQQAGHNPLWYLVSIAAVYLAIGKITGHSK